MQYRTQLIAWFAIIIEQIDTTLEKEMYEQANKQVTDDTSKGLNRAWNELQYRVNTTIMKSCYTDESPEPIHQHYNIFWDNESFSQIAKMHKS